MGPIDVVKVLGYGVIGLGFLLAFMAFRLLSAEQKKPKPTDRMLKSIREYMWFSIAITILGGVFLLADRFIPTSHNNGGKSEELTPNPTASPTPNPTASPNPVSVELSEAIGNELRNVELVAGAAKITLTGKSHGVSGTNAIIYGCVQYDEAVWWCTRANVQSDGSWSANLYPTGVKPPFKDESEIKLRAVVNVDGPLPADNSKNNEFPEQDIERFRVKSSQKNVKVFLKK